MAADPKIAALADEYAAATPSELGNADRYLTKLAEALGVPAPGFAGTGYEAQYNVRVVHRDGTDSINRIDLFKEGCFVLEAKDEGESKDPETLMRKAFGQVSNYAAFVPGGPPPYLMVLDVGRTLRVWDRWSGSYGGYQAAVRSIDLRTLADRPDDIAFLRDVWERPQARNPNARAAAVTKDIAGKLAELASQLEKRHEQERVARFLIRCVFTMFAEDIGLLEEQPFTRAVQKGFEDPLKFDASVATLWAAMDTGGPFGMETLLRFNGHFFADQEVVSLSRPELGVLLEATRADWKDVEPSIFGTLLTRALDAEERHRLGAEFTPRAYVERLVRPTIEEPVRERWTLVQAEVIQLKERGRPKNREQAVVRIREFLDYLRSIRVLDPACGSGNFLYVALSILKEIELEAIREIESITGQREIAVEEVGPWQFHGIEVKPWAREVAELCLWVGYHQWWRRTHGHIQPPEPVLRDTGNLECRDAVLAWDEIVHRPEKDRPDPTPRIPHPVTGELVPDPTTKLPYYEYVGARQAEWPKADYIVGNPPFLGNRRMREEFGDGYVDALRSSYPEVGDSADYVMYWWYKASESARVGSTVRAGLITTNSITQRFNRAVVAQALKQGGAIIWAIPDHPWSDASDAAAVKVAMTVVARGPAVGRRLRVDSTGAVSDEAVLLIGADLGASGNVADAASIPLKANVGISFRGVIPRGSGFIIAQEEATRLVTLDSGNAKQIRPWVTVADLMSQRRELFVIDFEEMSEQQAASYPMLFDIVRDRVRPDRQGKNELSARTRWWTFWRSRPELRAAVAGLESVALTPYVSKHHPFVLFAAKTLPDDGVVTIASSDLTLLGVLSSALHQKWALSAGSVLEDRPRYNNTTCFDAFPFPDPPAVQREVIAEIAEGLEAHRKAALARDELVTMTGMYNVVEKLRSGEALTPKERKIHELAACGVLRDLHDELDAAVAEAYGWPWPMETEEILERLVAVHDERVAEEKRGIVRWLRPEYQVPRFRGPEQVEIPEEAPPEESEVAAESLAEWPSDAIEQLTALRAIVAERASSVEEAARRFRGARRTDVAKHLETLEVLGVVSRSEGGRYQTHATGTPVVV